MRYHTIKAIDDKGAPTDQLIGQVFGAGLDAVRLVHNAPHDDEDGRSEFVWVLLQSGDWILGCFPQGDTFMATEAMRDRDYQQALADVEREITWLTRDIGYGPEEGEARGYWRGEPDWTGKTEFVPTDGSGKSIFLFPDEVLTDEPVSVPR